MILITNLGNRDVVYNGVFLNRNNVRQEGERLFNNYESKKEHLSYPIISPILKRFKDNLKSVYLFVTNQEDEMYKNSDSIFIGSIIRKWIIETYFIDVNVVQYSLNPTDHEKIYSFYTSYFSENKKIFEKTDKRIISLSGGTPQMNGALYVILSSIFLTDTEFYNVDKGKLIPVNHDKTIKKIYVKNSCIELLKIYQYQSIIQVLNEYNIENRNDLIFLLQYAHFRKTFDFEEAQKNLSNFLNSIPTSAHNEYQSLTLNVINNPIDLIRELFWNLEISNKNQDYLGFIGRLFRLEEAIFYEILSYFYKSKLFHGNLTSKKIHPEFIKNLQEQNPDLWNSLRQITFKTIPLDINFKELNRPILFYIAKLHLKEMTGSKEKSIIREILNIFDKINKYCYDNLNKDDRKYRYGHETSMECLGDLRNSSIIAHGFQPVSKEKIEKLYGKKIENLMPNLKKKLENLLSLFLNSKISLINPFDNINKKILNLILQL